MIGLFLTIGLAAAELPQGGTFTLGLAAATATDRDGTRATRRHSLGAFGQLGLTGLAPVGLRRALGVGAGASLEVGAGGQRSEAFADWMWFAGAVGVHLAAGADLGRFGLVVHGGYGLYADDTLEADHRIAQGGRPVMRLQVMDRETGGLGLEWGVGRHVGARGWVAAEGLGGVGVSVRWVHYNFRPEPDASGAVPTVWLEGNRGLRIALHVGPQSG